jgi:hypothetical protein
MLNTCFNPHELNTDGSSKYPNYTNYRYGQEQFDFLINEALKVEDGYCVIVSAHIPANENKDGELMCRMLHAYNKKTSYSGTAGNAGGYNVNNLASPTSADWVTGYRLSTSGTSQLAGAITTNYIPCKLGDTIRIKGLDISTISSGNARFHILNSSKTLATADCGYIAELISNGYGSVNGDEITITAGYTGNSTSGELSATAYMRFCGTLMSGYTANSVIITVNEEIVMGEAGYDYVSVNADFSGYKGDFIGYFCGHSHADRNIVAWNVPVIGSRCDAKEENDATLKAERVAGTITEQSFDVFTVNKAERKIYATKIGAGTDREISY